MPSANISKGKENEEISRLMEECGIEFVFSCAYPGNFFIS